jgi:hypothetical protein
MATARSTRWGLGGGGDESAGKLKVHCEDAFAAKPADPEGFAGIFVDLFAESQLLPQQELKETWERLLALLRPQG